MESKNVKIVVISGDRETLKSLDKNRETILSDIQLTAAEEALQGLEIARQKDPDVVLVDINLPELTSEELCEKIKADQVLRDTPVIVLADAGAAPETRLKALDAGADAFISKPFNMVDLKALIRVMAELKTARRRFSGSAGAVRLGNPPATEPDGERDEELSPGTSLSGQMMKSIIEMAQDSIFVKDRLLRYVMINAAMIQHLGLPEKAIVGRTDSELFGEVIGRIVKESDLRVLNGEIVEEFPIKSIQGIHHYFHTIKVPLRDSQEKISGLYAIEREITESKRLEEKLHVRLNGQRCVVRCIKIMAEEGDLESRVRTVLQILKEMLNVSRVYVVVNEEYSLQVPCKTQRCEVCDSNITPRSDFETLRHLPASVPALQSALLARKPYFGSVLQMTGNEREKQESQGVQSILILPIYCESNLWGFIGFDDCRAEREWTEEDIGVLSVVADSIGTSVFNWRVVSELRESESRYQTFINASQDLIFVKDENFRYVIVNEATLRFFNTSRAEILHKTDYDIMDESGAALCLVSDREAISTGSVIKCEELLSGRIFDVSKFPVAIRQGKLGVGAIVRDISDHRRSEAERERLITAIEQLQEVIVITDTQGLIQYVNPAFSKVTGYSRNEVIGKNPRIFKSSVQNDEFYKQLWNTILSGKTWQGTIVNLRRDGTTYTEEATISPVFAPNGTITNFAAVKRDISEELLLTMQLQHAQKMESIGRLAGGVAHDFNNMLSVILGYSQLARDQVEPSQPLFSDLEEIIKAATRSKQITQQLLAFARIQMIAPVVLDLNGHIGNTLKMMQRLISEEIELVWKPAEHLWPIKMDPAQIDQILANLCVNAKDAINGVGTITIQTGNVFFNETHRAEHPAFPPGEYVFLQVRDNGCGMSPEVMKNLFEPFFTTKDINRGTGLGLATIYGIVKQNKGYISVDSEPGNGSVFELFFPKYSGSGNPPENSISESIPVGNGELILVVDDEKEIVKLVKKNLEDLNYRVLTAVNPVEAIAIIESQSDPIDVLITDVVMPDMNGLELAQKLKKIIPDLKTLFISGYEADIIARHDVLSPGIRFLPKPFSKNELAVQVSILLHEDLHEDLI